MLPSTDKSYIDAKSDALEAGQKGWMQAYEARMDARFAAFSAEVTRWVAGIVLGTAALTMSFMTFLIVQVAPRLMAPAPAAPPAPASAAVPPTVIYVLPPSAQLPAPPAPQKQP
jgi:hypothetical protein